MNVNTGIKIRLLNFSLLTSIDTFHISLNTVNKVLEIVEALD
jgi:hypothetical protein